MQYITDGKIIYGRKEVRPPGEKIGSDARSTERVYFTVRGCRYGRIATFEAAVRSFAAEPYPRREGARDFSKGKEVSF